MLTCVNYIWLSGPTNLDFWSDLTVWCLLIFRIKHGDLAGLSSKHVWFSQVFAVGYMVVTCKFLCHFVPRPGWDPLGSSNMAGWKIPELNGCFVSNIYISIHPSIYLSICIYLFVCLSVCLSVYPFTYLSIWIYIDFEASQVWLPEYCHPRKAEQYEHLGNECPYLPWFPQVQC